MNGAAVFAANETRIRRLPALRVRVERLPMWKYLLRPILFLFDAEKVHYATMGLFAAMLRFPPLRALTAVALRYRSERLRTEVAGLALEAPVGLGAGFDKNARWFNQLDALGFGFVEVGTLTGRAQGGNPKPRIFRLKADRALLNRMGFNNDGSEAAAQRLEGATIRPVLGVNIGKSKVVANEDAVDDYLASLRRLRPFADYITVNVSSPNTKGLRDLQAKDPLSRLLGAIVDDNRALALAAGDDPCPVFVKIAPDLDEGAMRDVVELCVEVGISGIIATNTTISREGLQTPEAAVSALGNGGVSGAPLTERSRRFVATLYRLAAGRLPIIGVGGIMTPDDAWQMLRAGAAAVQVYSGFVYGGPHFVRRTLRYIDRQLAGRGSDLKDVVGEASEHYSGG